MKIYLCKQKDVSIKIWLVLRKNIFNFYLRKTKKITERKLVDSNYRIFDSAKHQNIKTTVNKSLETSPNTAINQPRVAFLPVAINVRPCVSRSCVLYILGRRRLGLILHRWSFQRRQSASSQDPRPFSIHFHVASPPLPRVSSATLEWIAK